MERELLRLSDGEYKLQNVAPWPLGRHRQYVGSVQYMYVYTYMYIVYVYTYHQQCALVCLLDDCDQTKVSSG